MLLWGKIEASKKVKLNLNECEEEEEEAIEPESSRTVSIYHVLLNFRWLLQ